MADTPGKWYYSVPSVIAAVLVLGPLAFPLLWKSPRFSLAWKILITLLTTAAAIFLTAVSWELYRILWRSLKAAGLV